MHRDSSTTRKTDFFNLFIFGCAGSFLLGASFLQLAQSGSYSLVMECGLLTLMASLVVEHGLQDVPALVVAPRGLSSGGTQAYLLHGARNLPRPRIEPVSLALQGRFLTTEPPGKP